MNVLTVISSNESRTVFDNNLCGFGHVVYIRYKTYKESMILQQVRHGISSNLFRK